MKEFKIIFLQCLILIIHFSISYEGCTSLAYEDGTTKTASTCDPTYMRFNCKCFKNVCPDNTETDPDSSVIRNCRCKYKYYVDGTDYHCLAENQPCPTSPSSSYPYFIDGNSQCFTGTNCDSITNSKLKIVRDIVTKDGTVNYQCVSSCNDDEVLDTDNNKCLKTCKSLSKKLYYPEKRECVENCISGDFEYTEKGTCHKFCETALNILDAGKKYCTEKASCSETEFPFLYSLTNTCVKQCSDISSTGIYSYTDSSNQKKCVTDCSLTLMPYIKNNVCVPGCALDETIVNGVCTANSKCTSPPYKMMDTSVCVEYCPPDYYSDSTTTDDKKCYKECPYDKYYKYNSKECVAFAKATNFIVLNDNSRILYPSSCPSFAPYYNDDGDFQHICFSSSIGCSDKINPDPTRYFSESSDPYKCKSSCTDTTKPKTEKFVCLTSTTCPESYSYNSNNICYKNGCPEEEMDYYISGTEKKCFTKVNCPVGLNYIQDGECVSQCDTILYPYKIAHTEASGARTALGYCFKTSEGCFNKGYYYYDKTKVCSTTPCDKKIQNEPGTNHPLQREQGTCLDAADTNCPKDYPYKGVTAVATKFTCYKDECPDGEYAPYPLADPIVCTACTTANTEFKYKKYCVTGCTATPYTLLDETTNECVEKCPDARKYISGSKCKANCASNEAYDPTTFECLTSCLGVKDYQFLPLSTTLPKPCQSSCNTGEFYSDSDKKCVNTCGTYKSSSDPKRCVAACESWEKEDANKYCKTTCSESYFVVKDNKAICCSDLDSCKTSKSDITAYSNSTRQYFDKCPVLEPYLSAGVCYAKCPSDYPYYYYDSTTTTCYASCVSVTNNNFHIQNGYQCIPTCPDDRKFVKENTKVCLMECPKDYPYYYKEAEANSYFTCFAKCPAPTYKAWGFECEKTCGKNNYKQFLYEANNTCLVKCPDEVPFYEEITGTGGTPTYYKCVDHCENTKFISPSNQCLTNCPDYAPFIGKKNYCKKACDPIDDGNYYYLYHKADATINYDIKKCLISCETDDIYKYKVYNTFECLSKCPPNYYESPDKICYKECNLDPKNPFSTTNSNNAEDHKKVCNTKCLDGGVNYFSNKVCGADCSTSEYNKTIDENGACVVHCHYDKNSTYKYEDVNVCKEACTGTNKQYSKKDYKCIGKCPEEEEFIRTGGECGSSCDYTSSDKFAYRKASTDKNYICRQNCSYPNDSTIKLYYYESDYICLEDCNKEEHTGFNIQFEHKCVLSCDPNSEYKFIYFSSTSPSTSTSGKDHYTQDTCVKNCNDTDQPFTLENNTCSTGCVLNRKNYLSDKVCISACPAGTYTNTNPDPSLKDHLNECVNECEKTKSFLTGSGECADKCDSTYGYEYYFESDRICRQSCGNAYVDTTTKICYTSCPQGKEFAYDLTCVANCKSPKPFFVFEFEQGETNIQKKCLTDCPEEYPYFIETASGSKIYKCYSNCSKIGDNYYYIRSKDPLQKAKECTQVCNNFIAMDGECLAQCPEATPFYIDESGKKKCYQTCPDKYSHEENSYLCISYNKCNEKNYYIDYETHLCVPNCARNQLKGKLDNNNYCVKECNNIFGLLTTLDHQCVHSCSENNDFIIDESRSQCLCKNLFYRDKDNGETKCLDSEKNICIEVEGGKYKYNMEGTKECASICKTISTEDFVCMKENSTCPKNTYLYYYPDGSAVCKCQYKYYKNNLQQIICLGELDNCPSGYNKIIVSSKECIQKECNAVQPTALLDFQGYCFSKENCPKSFDSSTENTCKCEKNWYKKVENGDYQFICLDSTTNCVADYPFMIKKNGQTQFECIKKCMNSEEDSNEYNILYGNTCIDTCPANTKKVELLPNDSSYQYSHFTCYCNNLWYHDLSATADSQIHCETSDSKKHCIGFDNGLYYQIKETHECVKECPSNYPYKFNDECLTNCEQGAIFGYDLQKKANTDFECECKNVWALDSSDSKINVKKCFNNCEESKTTFFTSLSANEEILEIKATKECKKLTKCPEEYPLRFNNECYAINSCPSNSHSETKNAENCVCDNLWYYTDTEEKVKYCMGKTDNSCPLSDDTKKYLIINKNQCTNLKNCKDLYVFNFYCYHNKCPDETKAQGTVRKTIDGGVSITFTNCTCDENFGYWYHEMKEADYLTCGRTDSCPEGKSNIIEGTKECVHDCGQTSEYRVHLLNSCLKGNSNTACPGTSYKIGLVEGVVECHYRTLDNSTSKAELAQFVSEDISLYYTKDTKTDFVYSKHNINLQIYGINKNKMSDAELMRKADLSYLDLSKCVDKIYKSNNLTDDENVIIAKYDVLDTEKSYMINSVEYEFFSSKTYKKIDPSVCEAKSIVISYPVSYTVTKYDGSNNEVYNPYKKVFNLAKDLIKENPEYDVYNSSSPIYRDPCITTEIDGKDLVLEDRANYLYPSASTCENNCTFNNTDYEQERINCLCSPKETFDINRNQPIINYNFSIDEINDNQGGSSNLPVFNCLSRLNGKNKISKNGGFYYMVVATVAQVALVIVSWVVGYSRAVAKIGKGLQVNPEIENSANPPPKDGFNSDPANQQENRYIDSRSNMKDDPNQQINQNNNRNQSGHNNRNIQQGGNAGLITIKKISPDKERTVKNKGEKMAIYDEKEGNEEKDSEEDSVEKDISSSESLFKEIRKEQKMLRYKFQNALRNDNNGVLIMILAAIFDKIYLTKTFFFRRKYDMFSAYLSLYILFHVLLLTVTAFFFDIDTIKKIWNKKNFPGVEWYLLYGLISNIIVWFVYKLLNCLLSNNDKIENLYALKYNDDGRREYLKNKKGISTEELLYLKYQKVIREIKIKMIIYYVLCFAIFVFSFIYLTVFCGIYTGTKKRVFKCYGISLIEILIIKIVYGIALGAMRKTSIESKIKCLYKVVRTCSIYLS